MLRSSSTSWSACSQGSARECRHGDKYLTIQFNHECLRPHHLDLSCFQVCTDQSRNSSETLHQARYHESMYLALPNHSARIYLVYQSPFIMEARMHVYASSSLVSETQGEDATRFILLAETSAPETISSKHKHAMRLKCIAYQQKTSQTWP